MKKNTFGSRLFKILFLSIGFFILCLFQAKSQTPGDVDANGMVNRGDSFKLINHLLDLVPLSGDDLLRADTNQDARIDSADMVTVNINTSYTIQMILVPSGTFTMGARDDGDDGTYRTPEELPRHQVTLSPYEIGKYELTNGQYCQVLNWALSKGYLQNSGGGAYSGGDLYKNGNIVLKIESSYCQIEYSSGSFTWKYRDTQSMENHPVLMVSWWGAAAFCNWLSEMEGFSPAYSLSSWEPVDKDPVTPGIQFTNGYRLPTEAEWERAAGWDGSKRWIYGFLSDDGNNTNQYNHYDEIGALNYMNPMNLSAKPYTSPVGWFNGVNISPNGNIQTVNGHSPVGCSDMSGNVLEWCHDWLSLTYYSSGDMVNPTGPSGGTTHIARGGCWENFTMGCRTADRYSRFPVGAANDLGFRLARSR
jgi:formylglycine-generating enzyme required for sulfatase activity